MTNREPRDVSASVRQRLLNLARERGDDFQLVLTRYALERLLYRLGRTEHRDRFILKGATLFSAWFETPYVPTPDTTLPPPRPLGVGAPSRLVSNWIL